MYCSVYYIDIDEMYRLKTTCFICVRIGAGKSGHRQHRNRIMKVINHDNVKLCNKNVNLVEKNYLSSQNGFIN